MESNIDENSNIAIRKTSMFKFIFLCIITFGIYWYFWIWKVITDINKLYPEKYIHRTFWFIILITLEILSVYFDIKNPESPYLYNTFDFIWIVVQLLLIIQILKNLENYIKNSFEIVIKHNRLGFIFFGSLYLNYKINTLSKSIKNAHTKKLEEIKRNF